MYDSNDCDKLGCSDSSISDNKSQMIETGSVNTWLHHFICTTHTRTLTHYCGSGRVPMQTEENRLLGS